jgi:5-methylthioadenosine/S-adenosylhomocysteine deaminase
VLANAINYIGLRGVVDAYDEVYTYGEKAYGNVMYCCHIPEEEDISDEQLEGCREVKEKLGITRMTHCLETKWRRDLVLDKYKMSTVQLLDDNGLLDNKTVLFHCVHLTDEDMDTVAKRSSSIVYCPVSNMWSGTGITHISKWLDRNINVCLGTDFILTDIWEVMRTAYYLNKVNTSITRITAGDIFKMATINGAKAVDMDREIGCVESGYKADLIFINKNDTRLMPLIETGSFSTVVHNLLLECREDMIMHVMVNGRWIMKDREILTVNEGDIDAKYHAIVNRLYKGKIL